MKISFQQVSKKYGSTSALKDISFEVEEGGFIFITGPSGAGKTTLLKLLLAQIMPTTGKVFVGSIEISNSKKNIKEKIRRNIGVVYQDYQLINDKTVLENILLALDIINYPLEKRTETAVKAIKQVGLSGKENTFPSQLSGGELQRASLARALSIQPKVILADEPTGNLDQDTAKDIVHLLDSINKELKTTILMTTHNPSLIEMFTHPVIHLQAGELVKQAESHPKKPKHS